MKALTPIYGFHGCDEVAAEKILKSRKFLKSDKTSEWLGSGIYFWENDPLRALEWAEQRSKSPKVIGVIINPESCLDLSSREAVPLLKKGYQYVCEITKKARIPLPQNKGRRNDKDEKNRLLDCAVINALFENISPPPMPSPP